eukprot:scaffold277828_cov14-Tisochrysis_lutea.AAC.1
MQQWSAKAAIKARLACFAAVGRLCEKKAREDCADQNLCVLQGKTPPSRLARKVHPRKLIATPDWITLLHLSSHKSCMTFLHRPTALRSDFWHGYLVACHHNADSNGWTHRLIRGQATLMAASAGIQ